MKKESQYNQPLGSNPATAQQAGAANVQLNNTQSSLTPKKFDKLMDRVKSGRQDDALKSEIEDAMSIASKPETKDKLQKIYNSLNMNNDKRKSTIDPDTKKQIHLLLN